MQLATFVSLLQYMFKGVDYVHRFCTFTEYCTAHVSVQDVAEYGVVSQYTSLDKMLY